MPIDLEKETIETVLITFCSICLHQDSIVVVKEGPYCKRCQKFVFVINHLFPPFPNANNNRAARYQSR